MNIKEMKEVPFDGSLQSKYYIVGESPGQTEEFEGKPFMGSAGKLLWGVLFKYGITREQCRIANLMSVRPPNNDFQFFYQPENLPSLEEGIKKVKDDIRQCKPNIVIALGNEVLKALTGNHDVGSWRGSVLWVSELGCKVMPTFHPSGVLRQWDYFPLFSADLAKAGKEGEFGEWKYTERIIHIAPTFEECLKYFEICKKAEKLAFDIETFSVPEKHTTVITALAFAWKKGEAVCIPFTKITPTGEDNAYWTIEQETFLMKEIASILSNPASKKYGQNAQYDMCVLEGCYKIKVMGLYIDTMCAHHTLYPELPKDLGTLCTLYTDQPFYKHWSGMGGDVNFWKYNGMDACVTFEIGEIQEKQMQEENLWEFYNKFVHPLIPIFIKSQIEGVKIDLMARNKAKEFVEKELVIAQKLLNDVVEYEINVASPKQMKELLYGEMQLPPKYQRGTKILSCNEKALMELNALYPSELFSLVLKVRRLRKVLSNSINMELKDGRAHTSYNLGGRMKEDGKTVSAPETGRISSTESIIFCCGTNLQNVPHKDKILAPLVRKMFIPDSSEYIFWGFDLSQAEARVVAWLAEEERMMEVFNSGKDIHRLNASWLFEKQPEEVTKEERDLAKRDVHAWDYRETVGGYAKRVGISYDLARKRINGYFDNFPKIKMWHKEIEQKLSKTGTLITPFGRKRTFFGRWGEDLFKEATAYIPQSTIGDLANLCIQLINNEAEKLKIDCALRLQTHDGVVYQVRKTQLQQFVDMAKAVTKVEILIKGRVLIVPFEMEVGENWEEMKKIS